MKKTVAWLVVCILMFSSLPCFAVDYDEVGAYNECCLLYPDFVDKVKDNGVNDNQIIAFLGSVEDNLLTYDGVLTEENFDTYMFNAIKDAFKLRKNRFVRDALLNAYPDSIDDARKGIVTEEFMPIYITVKRFLFGIKTPVITISKKGTEVFARSVNLPPDCYFVLAIYNKEGSLIKAKSITPNVVDSLFCDKEISYSAKVFAWDNFTPLCDSFELIFE